jgi:hypothetical protein
VKSIACPMEQFSLPTLRKFWVLNIYRRRSMIEPKDAVGGAMLPVANVVEVQAEHPSTRRVSSCLPLAHLPNFPPAHPF